jgi:hypothetical protein
MQTSESKWLHGMGTEGLTTKHMYTCETLYHFTCSECLNWWSYAGHYFGKEMVCPHCGLKNKTKLKDDSGN